MKIAGDQVYMTCHYTIKVPSWVEEYSITLIVFGVLFAIGGGIGYYYYSNIFSELDAQES